VNYAIDTLMRAAEDAARDRETHAEELAELTAERDEARAEVACLTAALATVTAERDGLRADMRKVLEAAEALADIGAARAAVERATTEAHCDDLRAALATARREGAEEMRAACMEACRDALRDPSDIAIIGRVAEAIRALPLDAPGGAT